MTFPAGVIPTTRARISPECPASSSGSTGSALGTRALFEWLLFCTTDFFVIRGLDVSALEATDGFFGETGSGSTIVGSFCSALAAGCDASSIATFSSGASAGGAVSGSFLVSAMLTGVAAAAGDSSTAGLLVRTGEGLTAALRTSPAPPDPAEAMLEEADSWSSLDGSFELEVVAICLLGDGASGASVSVEGAEFSVATTGAGDERMVSLPGPGGEFAETTAGVAASAVDCDGG